MRRVVSLLPSITELVCEIGAGPSLVAVTHECDYPVEVSYAFLLNNSSFKGCSQVVATLPRATTADINPHLLSQEEVHRQVCESLTQAHSLYGLDSTVLRDINPTHIFTQALCHVCSPTLEQVASRLWCADRETVSLCR
jgi:iron complex transport system substrate-binding protein